HLLDAEQMLSLDRWTVERARQLQEQICRAYDTYEFHRIYQLVHNFCNVDMGGFYLDIIKDRLYTTGSDSHPRRSAQTAMYHIAEGMVRWLAPILSFTAEEIWQELPGEREASVLLSAFTELPSEEDTRLDWQSLIEVRTTVDKALEALRDAGDIGSPLDAEVTVYASGALLKSLQELGDELRFVFITSEAAVADLNEAPVDATEGEGFKVSVKVSEHEKCIRCWHRREDVGKVTGHEEVCGRCADNVDGDGEQRAFA
ncbi:MAG: class I tRNA ligase family protein, partial [Gammaproteobacteria bacterium]